MEYEDCKYEIVLRFPGDRRAIPDSEGQFYFDLCQDLKKELHELRQTIKENHRGDLIGVMASKVCSLMDEIEGYKQAISVAMSERDDYCDQLTNLMRTCNCSRNQEGV